MNERPIHFTGAMVRAILNRTKSATRRVVKGQTEHTKCPYGAPGDRLWVRETWHPALRFGTEYEIEYKADGASRMIDAGWDGPTPAIDAAIDAGWQVPPTMPRWASRITLQITAVRIERAHDDSPWVWVLDFVRVG